MKDCNIVYNNQNYSIEEFKEVLKSDKNLLAKLLGEVQARMNLIKKVFEDNPVLSTYGTVMQYDKFLNETGKDITEVNVPQYLSWLGVDLESGKQTYTDNDRNLVIEDIIGKALSNLNLSEDITIDSIYRAVETEFNNLLNEANSKGDTFGAKYLEEIKDSVLGETAYEGSVREFINALLDVQQIDDALDQTGENIKEVGQSSYEVDITSSLSFKVKMILSGIKDSRKTPGFADIFPNLALNETIDVIHQAMSEANNNSFEDLITALEAKLKRNPEGLKFYRDIIDKLISVNNTNPEVINEILYNLYQPQIEMRFVQWTQKENGVIELSELDANSKNPLFLKRGEWVEKLKLNGLVELYEGNHYTVNPDKLARVNQLHDSLTKSFNEHKNIADVSQEELREFFNLFGITLDDKTYSNMFSNLSQNDINLVDKILNGKNSIVPVLKDNINRVSNQKGKVSFSSADSSAEGTITFNPLTFNNSQLNDLVKADNFVEFRPMGSMYIAGKTINMYQQPNPIQNQMKEFKEALIQYSNNLKDPNISDDNKVPGILKRFRDSPYTSNSFLIELMINNPEAMSKYIDTFMISLEALKKSGSKSRDDMGVTALSDKDSFLTLFGMFASSEGKYVDRAVSEKYGDNLSFRKGFINFPTMSDSSQLPFMKTVLVELKAENIANDKLDDATLSLLKEQLLYADLYRIADFITNTEASGTNIKEYDTGALWITGLPSLNSVYVTIETDMGEESVPFIELFRNTVRENPGMNNIEDIKRFVGEYAAEINAEIQDNISYEVDQFIKDDGTGAFYDFEIVDKKGKFQVRDGSSNDYTKGKTARHIAYDYVVNNLIQQKEIQSFFAGDVALYFKSRIAKQLENGLPKVTELDILNFHFDPETVASLLNAKRLNEENHFSPEAIEALLKEYPEAIVLFSPSSTEEIQQIENLKREVVKYKIAEMFKDVQNNLSKRLKGQISPGSQLKDTKNITPHLQLVLEDVDSASESLKSLVSNVYPDKIEKLAPKLERFRVLNEQNNTVDKENPVYKPLISEYKELLAELKKEVPLIASYLETASTDAQEYVTWEDNLNQLLTQGRISKDKYESLKNKFERQSEDLEKGDSISPENLFTEEEMKLAIMQPSKPLYSGLVNTEVNGHSLQRYVYVKSSSFPLLPQMTQMFPKLNNLRKNMEKLSKARGTTVRAAYQSAIKVGSLQRGAIMNDLYSPQSVQTLESYSIELPRQNFFIQQDKPFKSDANAEKGKEDRITRATQFEKILLGDGINRMGKVFSSKMFDSSLLEDLGIDVSEGLISGPDLKKIYDELYRREQKLFKDKLFDKLGITSYGDIATGKPSAMENLVRILNKRLNNKQDRKALELLYEIEVPYVGSDNIRRYKKETVDKETYLKRGLPSQRAVLKIPLYLTPNSRKFESVLNSEISKNSINLSLPGFSAPVASQEGFDFRGFSEEAYKQALDNGLIVTKNFDPSKGLQATQNENGELTFAQVFAPSKYKIFNSETGKYEYINLKDFVDENNVIDNSKLPQELLSFFSYRIPTSAHLSGTMIEIAGFLPHNMGDVLIVPKDHTVQIGEDYDIDIRNMYGYHIIKDENGNLKKVDYSDISEEGKDSLENRFTELKQLIFDKYFKDVDGKARVKNPAFRHNQETLLKIASLNNVLDTWGDPETKKVLGAIQEEMDFDGVLTKRDIRNYIKDLELDILPKERIQEAREDTLLKYRRLIASLKKDFKDKSSSLIYYQRKAQKVDEQKVIENNIVSLYKSVFSSSSPEVQNMITKVLSTDFSEETASAVDNKLTNKTPYFNIFSPSVQRKVMKLGADGKMGIGVHSNSVTFASILQQLDSPLQFFSSMNPETGEMYPYNIRLGKNTFKGVLGQMESFGVKISETLMESQNSATDNQKLEIMGRRNENSETINVFSLMQISGLERDGVAVNVDGKKKELSYPSLFISQPILQEFVDEVKKLKSSTSESFGDPIRAVIEKLRDKYAKLVPASMWAVDGGKIEVGTLHNEARHKLGTELTSEKLYNQIMDFKNPTQQLDPASQFYILDVFSRMQKPARQFSELQKIVNIESSGMGVSYFDAINKKNALLNLESFNIRPQSTIVHSQGETLFESLIGEKRILDVDNVEGIEEAEKDGFIFFSSGQELNTYVKPKNHFAHKIINSVSAGYNLWNSLFPYDTGAIKSQVDAILSIAGLSSTTQAGLDLSYDIISSMKDYSFTASNTLFGGQPELVKNKIFFDDKNSKQESLSSYLLRLKSDPVYSQMFEQPFFRDLQFQINSEDFPSIIKYTTGDMSTFNNLRVYNSLEKMVNSKRELPNKLNGEPVTEESLMRDLLVYALISDQENGAIGFRHLLPMSLFEKYNVDALLRKNSSSVGDFDNSSIVFKGAKKAAENFLNSTINDFGVIENNSEQPKTKEESAFYVQLLNANLGSNIFMTNSNGDIIDSSFTPTDYNEDLKYTFVKQYVQHNPSIVKPSYTYSENKKSNFRKLLDENGFTLKNFSDGMVKQFSIESNVDHPFITLKNSRGEIYLYERTGSSTSTELKQFQEYKRIDTLGAFGFNEYQVGKEINSSSVEKNKVSKGEEKLPINMSNATYMLTEQSVRDVFSSMINSPKSEYAPLLKLIESFIPDIDKVSFSLVDANNFTGFYNTETNTIQLSTKALNDYSVKRIEKLLVEELLHHITHSHISPYINFTGVTSDGQLQYSRAVNEEGEMLDIPPSLEYLLNIYQNAVEYYVKKYGIEKFSEDINAINNININVENTEEAPSSIKSDQMYAYRLKNIHEFLAGIFLKGEEFSTEMATTPYKKSGKSFLAKFSEALARFFRAVLPFARKDSISAHTATSLFNLMKEASESNNTNMVFYENPLTKSDIVAKSLDFLKNLTSIDSVLPETNPEKIITSFPAKIEKNLRELFDIERAPIDEQNKIKEDFNNQIWSNPKVERDGSKASPMMPETFTSLGQYYTFVKLVESHSNTGLKAGETYGKRQTRINQTAMSELISSFKRDDTLTFDSLDDDYYADLASQYEAKDVYLNKSDSQSRINC